MRKNIGIYFVSKHLQTTRIAHFLGDWFVEHGSDVHVADLSQGMEGLPEVRNFDAVLVRASVHRGHVIRGSSAGSSLKIAPS